MLIKIIFRLFLAIVFACAAYSWVVTKLLGIEVYNLYVLLAITAFFFYLLMRKSKSKSSESKGSGKSSQYSAPPVHPIGDVPCQFCPDCKRKLILKCSDVHEDDDVYHQMCPSCKEFYYYVADASVARAHNRKNGYEGF